MGAIAALAFKAVPGLGLLPPWAWRAIAYGLVVASILGFVFFKGMAHTQAKWDKAEADRALATVRLVAARERVVVRTEVQVRKEIKTIREKGEQIVKEVPVYVTKNDDAACSLRVGFVRNYDAGLLNEPAGAPLESDRAPSGIALSSASEVINHNNAAFAECRRKLDKWLRFYTDLRNAKPVDVKNP